MAKKLSVPVRPFGLIDAGMLRDTITAVAMLREMCDAQLYGGTPTRKKIQADLKCAEELLTMLRPMLD